MDLTVSHDDEARQQGFVGRSVTVDSDEDLALIIRVKAGRMTGWSESFVPMTAV
ncbi:hypothetical protein [Streptomyces sp. NPDC050388]|uniref:hypothetical protein n=1 Tax=Streptomyces sp. NPDC050388 TaxID=3155781 RepID=UPI0034243F8A